MSKITVTTIAGQTSGSDANKVKIESGDTLEVVSNATVGGTLGVTGHAAVGANVVDATRALTVVGATDGTGSSIIVGYNSSLASKFSVRDDGYVNVGNGLNLADGNLSVASGHGIDFSAVSHASGMSSELLDSYEEGSWTANLIGSSSNPSSAVTVTGQYTKIGQLVYVNAQFSNFNNSGASGGVRVNGLPFTPSPGNQASGNIMIQTAGTWGGTNTAGISPYFGATYVGFYGSQQGAAWFEITHNTTAAGYLSFSGTYKTTA